MNLSDVYNALLCASIHVLFHLIFRVVCCFPIMVLINNQTHCFFNAEIVMRFCCFTIGVAACHIFKSCWKLLNDPWVHPESMLFLNFSIGHLIIEYDPTLLISHSQMKETATMSFLKLLPELFQRDLSMLLYTFSFNFSASYMMVHIPRKLNANLFHGTIQFALRNVSINCWGVNYFSSHLFPLIHFIFYLILSYDESWTDSQLSHLRLKQVVKGVWDRLCSLSHCKHLQSGPSVLCSSHTHLVYIPAWVNASP